MDILNLNSSSQAWEDGFVLPLLVWYDTCARDLPWRREPLPYRVWVSEIMLQQTRVEAALPYFERFMKALPTLEDLADASMDELYKLWEGLGYYSRVRNLQRTAQMILQEYDGHFPLSLQEMKRLPGIGDYTAGAILSIAFSMPVPAVDGNVLRVLSRITMYDQIISHPSSRKVFSKLVERILPCDRPGDFNQAMMDLGADICRPVGEPLCDQCPVRTACAAFSKGCTSEFPIKEPKKKRRIEERTVLVILSSQGVFLRQRPKAGLLANMWEYPNFDGKFSKEQIRALFPEDAEISALADSCHIFTHVEWKMTGYLIRLPSSTNAASYNFPEQMDGVWSSPEQHALPSAFKSYTELLRQLTN